METLTSSAGSKLTFDKQRHRYFFSSKELYVNNRPQLTFLPSKNHVNGRFSELLSLRNKTVQAISYIQADSQGEMENVAQEEHIYESNTVHVKFQIQKECRFGERFFVVGDDPIFGLWDPESAIPLDWSEEHVWSVELDLPVGKTIQFKFMLKEATGDILWQPGADRTIQTWETKNTITILEDWDNAEYQKIIEEEPAANQNGKLDVESEVILADEFIQPKKELVFGLGDTSDAANTDMDRSTTPDNRRAATVNKSSDDEGNLISHEGEPVLVSGLTPLEAVSTETDIQNENQSADASLVMNEAQNHSLPEVTA
ncbi:uncharacterized protein LOC123209167 [Mangifera indica]|uniref:uncharacterized protein LOC123209167 n=1 Tax=Mangifera indica TaxID=29780 RepID=UPI001CFAF891|nr:uncharacterized protein LOC123209167 [Mangifera indica]